MLYVCRLPLKRPEGKLGHEEGVQTSLSHLRGSHSLAQLSDGVIGFERNQQDEIQNNVMTARVLKNRYSGDTGIACSLTYNKETGRFRLRELLMNEKMLRSSFFNIL